jgi:hypothetical protein
LARGCPSSYIKHVLNPLYLAKFGRVGLGSLNERCRKSMGIFSFRWDDPLLRRYGFESSADTVRHLITTEYERMKRGGVFEK